MFGNLKKRKTEFNEKYIQELIPAIQKDKVFVAFAKDSTSDKVHIQGFLYNIISYTDASNDKPEDKIVALRNRDSVFDVYFDSRTQKYSFKFGFILTQPESAKRLYQIANEKLQEPAYYYKKVNHLRKKIKAEQTRLEKEAKKSKEENFKTLDAAVASVVFGNHSH